MFVNNNIVCYWRASETSETLSGVTQLKIGDICYTCLDVCKAFLYFHPRVFVLVLFTLEIELFTVLNSFAGAVKT